MSANDSKQVSALTEQDMFRQVASSLTKKLVQQDPTQIDNSKSIFANIMKKLAKVWRAFAKFLKNQCELKGKAVDTQILGLFMMKQGSQTLCLYPSPEFLDAGKFKLPKFMRQQMMEQNMSYEELYVSLKAQTELSIMNFGSIGSVCNLQQDATKQYLTDIFSCLIEINRKTKKEVKLQLGAGAGAFGALHLFSNGEIYFQKTQELGEQSYFDTESVFKHRSQTRDEVSHAIDNASAILSQNGGRTFSVRTGFLSSITSIATPKSQYSQRSLKSNANADFFAKYRNRSKAVKKGDDIFESKPTGPPKANDDGLTAQLLESLNLGGKSRTGKSHAHTVNDEGSTRSSEQYNHVDAYVSRGMGNRLTKKFQFEKDDKNELLQFICDQMQYKKDREIHEKVDKIMKERQDLKKFKKKLADDQVFQHEDKLRKKLEFLSQNEMLITKKVQTVRKNDEDKHKERMNYFPFTHGDAIEKQRAELAELQKNELNEKFMKKQQAQEIERKNKQEKYMRNKELTDARLRKMIETQKQDEAAMLNQFNEIEQKRMNGEDIDEDFQRHTTGQALAPTFPAFTKSIKKQQQSRFGAENPLFAKSMRLALERHEQKLQIEAAEREMQRQDFIDGQLYEKLEEEQEKVKAKEKYVQYKKELDVQIEFAQNQRELAKLESKELHNTNLGPEDNVVLRDFKQTTVGLKKQKNKQELRDQVQEKKDKKKAQRELDLEQDRLWVEEDLLLAKEAKEKEQMIQNMYKERNARVWIEQTNLKYKADQVENLFV